ncbi:hypothetical protein CO057_03740 [Candidatus Uhrbacteria bacterium CG_4_9_14_0_2_um_filter_41_50]|uniref:Uncharacterized protein n=1 Tax=Candidatus Uhrbacteria bacterium CG_4_9_14_0_2_um_filter_41_50 TaxID=1975031 RepID=A0A2M8ENE5_9BACT|nr:MAG: hypothetical protein COZ45_04620 [Candidatus Uhrbacteria bacterium CG_4_10_14_3_um_filter_41_21]PIZ54902.1 MAG: hypothetical protein COY24_02220 [Candidatus Uhrbacteria bacterium CG_4_10_14_0_2_um_filter_41_21]PJB84519.1 MAG: hypothetical protein CO086_03225 [Candidatus Uhrbacteria bacterium CG_4_9_14_0_8_um_filter_41_16]PJC24273.1 MAG: hypothetical protein CO057_03740 [Candidatus Uhrbacteria bacterium CG_4_9_14_0_2_um_filter_41_50]PJE74707.1 MAG: hypothetical protein COV03_04090 [Candi
MHELLNDPIDVTVDFIGHRVRPKIIKWGNTIFNTEKVNLVHPAREGENLIFYFSISDHSHFLKLRFDTHNMEWRLVELYTD